MHNFRDVADMNIDEHLPGVVFAEKVCVTFDTAHFFWGFFSRRNVKDAPAQWWRQILRPENIVKWVMHDGIWYDLMPLNIPFDTKAVKILWLMLHYAQETPSEFPQQFFAITCSLALRCE